MYIKVNAAIIITTGQNSKWPYKSPTGRSLCPSIWFFIFCTLLTSACASLPLLLIPYQYLPPSPFLPPNGPLPPIHSLSQFLYPLCMHDCILWPLTLKWYSMLTRNGKLIEERIFFSFKVCSTCLSLTTFCLSRIFMAWKLLLLLCCTSITRPNEPVPRVFTRSKSPRTVELWGQR